MRKGWKRASLGDLGKCINGLTYSPTDVTDSTGLLVLRSSNVQNGKLSFDDNVYVTKLVAKESLAKEGDILVCVRNGSKNLIGKNCLITKEASGNAHGAFMTLFRSQNPEFVYQLLQTDRYYNQVRRNLGATINSINTSDFYEFTFDIPPLPEQHKIAAILRTWDDAIEKYDDVINIKVRLKNYLSIKLLSQKHNHHASKKLLGDLCDITTGKKDVNEGNPNGCYPFYSCAKETTFSDTYSFDTEAILISGNGVGVGYTHYYNGKFEAYQRTYVLSNFDTKSNIQYILYYLRQYLRQQILKEKQDSAMPYIKLGLLKEFEIPLPEIGQQLKIVSALMAVDEEIDGLRKQQSIIKSQKRGLMQKLLTGEWRVNVSGDAEAA